MIKIYECTKCEFSGIRKEVRKHLKGEHFIKAGRGTHKKKKGSSDSLLTLATKSREFK